jgi:sulfur carrier protein
MEGLGFGYSRTKDQFVTQPSSRIAINGETREVRASSIAGVIEELGLPPSTVLVEHNGDALQRSEWTSRTLKSGDRIEILRVAAGG